MTTISVHLDPDDPQAVAQAQRILKRLNDPPATMPANESVPQVHSSLPAVPLGSVAADAVADLWSRIGPSLRELVEASAQQEGEFSMGDLAEALGQSPNSVRSRFANLGRSIRAMRDAVPGAPHLYEEASRRDGIWYFTMPEAFREVILRTDVDES